MAPRLYHPPISFQSLTGHDRAIQADWSTCYAPGHEILQYIHHVVDKWKVRPLIKLQHEVVRMQWDEAAGQWIVRIRRPSANDPSTFEEFEDRADIVLNGTGGLDRWKWPDIEGLHEFKGPIVHSAGWNFGGSHWEEDVKDWGDKKVVVIGMVRISHLPSFPLFSVCAFTRLIDYPGLFRIANRVRASTKSGVTLSDCSRPNVGVSTVRRAEDRRIVRARD